MQNIAESYTDNVEILRIGIFYMDQIQKANQPNMINAFEAAMKTRNDSGDVLLEDLERAVKLIKQFKKDLDSLHPSIINIIKALF